VVLRLLALLPHRTPIAVPVPGADIAAVPPADFRARIGAVIVIMSAIALLGSQLIAAHRSAPMQPAVDHAPAVPAVPAVPSPALPTNQTQR
jgi:hypothetical protein